MVPIIIESPFRGYEERNRRYLTFAIRDAGLRGESPYASHRMLTNAFNDDDPEERALGISAGFAFRPRTKKTVVYLDLGISGGMKLGILDAEKIEHPIEYRRLFDLCRYAAVRTIAACDCPPCADLERAIMNPWRLKTPRALVT